MLCHVFWSQVEYKTVCFIRVNNMATCTAMKNRAKQIIYCASAGCYHVLSWRNQLTISKWLTNKMMREDSFRSLLRKLLIAIVQRSHQISPQVHG